MNIFYGHRIFPGILALLFVSALSAGSAACYSTEAGLEQIAPKVYADTGFGGDGLDADPEVAGEPLILSVACASQGLFSWPQSVSLPCHCYTLQPIRAPPFFS